MAAEQKQSKLKIALKVRDQPEGMVLGTTFFGILTRAVTNDTCCLLT
jgi:hypothetical protein